MSNTRTLREEVTSVLNELETMVRVVGEVAVVGGHASSCTDKVDKVVKLINDKQTQIKDIVKKAEEHAERQKIIERLQAELAVRNSYIEKIQNCLKSSETTLINAIFQANHKLKCIYQADNRKVTADELIRYAHKISKTNAVAAPLTWKQGDPSRPFPTDAQMRQGWLSNIGKPSNDLPPQFAPNITSALQSGNFQVPRMQQAQGQRIMSPHQGMFQSHMTSSSLQGMFPQPPGMRMPSTPNMGSSLPAPPPYGGHRQQWNQMANANNPSPNRFGPIPNMPISVGGGRVSSPRGARPPLNLPPVPPYTSPSARPPSTPNIQVPGSPRMFNQTTSRARPPALPMGIVPPGMKYNNTGGGPPAKKAHVAPPAQVEQMSSDSSSNSSSSGSPE